MTGREWGLGLFLAAAFMLSTWASPPQIWAGYDAGPITLTGNVSAQQLFRVSGDAERWQYIQQRNTLRLQLTTKLVEKGRLWHLETEVPWIDNVTTFFYWRSVYDSIYDSKIGGKLRDQSGKPAGSLANVRVSPFNDEHVLREAYADVDFGGPLDGLSMRLGKQQIVWGEADFFRSLDTINPLDVTWHLFFETGLSASSGWDELRIPQWMLKLRYDFGNIGPIGGVFLEGFYNPFDFRQTRFGFLPNRPWSLPLANPFRSGQLLDLGALRFAPAPPGAVFAEPRFQLIKGSNFKKGDFNKDDVDRVSQFGFRLGGKIPIANYTTLSLNTIYYYRRTYADVPQTGFIKAFPERATITPGTPPPPGLPAGAAFIGRVTLPVEAFFPYVNIWGLSGNFLEPYTDTSFRFETSYTKDLPRADVGKRRLISKGDMWSGVLGFDRLTWIRLLNPSTTFFITGQLFSNVWVTDFNKNLRGIPFLPTPSRDPTRPAALTATDHLRHQEFLLTLAIATFYRGGTVNPSVAVFHDLKQPSNAFFFSVDWFYTNNVIITPQLRIFTTWGHGKAVDDPWLGGGRNAGRSEVGFKVTYQF